MRRSIPTVTMLALLFACGEAGTDEEAATYDTVGMAADTVAPAAPGDSARADVRDADGRSVGTVVVVGLDGGVTLSGSLAGLPPGEHGFHVHQTGSCEPPSFSSAGGHLAPAGNAHGFDAEGGPHAGDLRNLTAGPDSSAVVDQTNERLTLRGGDAPLLDADGSALIVHAGADDYVSQPSGDSGVPIACGVIEGRP
ncbi:MAG TPA: superoxide dismutase family protein [Gemmatimonadota bacterium]|nr:superoxide dismutase family protein [Gemmatimonadota bacterium]